MFKKGKVPKQVYYDGELWKVEQSINPNRIDDYLLLSRKRSNQIHSDNETTPLQMILIDINNDEVFPVTKKIRLLVDSTNTLKRIIENNDRVLTQEWLNFVNKISNHLGEI